MVAVHLPVDADAVRRLEKLPACLFEREGLVLAELPEMGRTLVLLAEELLVAVLDALCHILDCLRAVAKEIGEARDFLEFGEVFLETHF